MLLLNYRYNILHAKYSTLKQRIFDEAQSLNLAFSLTCSSGLFTCRTLYCHKCLIIAVLAKTVNSDIFSFGHSLLLILLLMTCFTDGSIFFASSVFIRILGLCLLHSI